ncbi:hypothetical protein WEI85_27895 [Actinomycetes bacterium KLBMP 9797]
MVVSLPKRRISIALFGVGAALVAGAVVASNYLPNVATLSSEPVPTASPQDPPGPGELLLCGDSESELTEYPNRGITLPDLPLPAEETHPRLDFTAAELPAVRDRALGRAPDPHGLYQRNWQRILTDVGTGEIAGDSADDVNSRRAKAYAFAYVVTGNAGYRDTALAALGEAFQDFDEDDTYIAAQLTNYSQAYDYVAAELDRGGDQDSKARAAVRRGAHWLARWLDGKEPQGSNPRPHNHRSKAALALGLWALTFSSDRRAAEWLPKAVSQLNSVYQYMFTKDGVYLDGYAYYWTYQVFQVVPFLYAARNATGVDPFPAMRPVFEWVVRDSSPQGWLMNIEDSWVKTAWTAVVAEPYRSTETRLSRTAKLGNVLQWRFFAQDWAAPRYPDGWTGASNQAYTWPDEIIHIDQNIVEAAPDAGEFDFYDQGGNTTVLRSDWKYGDPATRWVMFYGAPQSNNHDHCDVMQVLLNAENTVLLNDSGYGPNRFSDRAGWFPPDRHNVVTMDGAGVRDVFANPVNLDGAAADYSEKLGYYDQEVAGTAGTKSWRRGVLFAAHDYVVIADSLHSPQPQQWESHLRSRGAFTREGPAAVWTTEKNVFGASAKLYALTLPASDAEAAQSGLSNLFGAKADVPDTEPTTYLTSAQRGPEAQFLSIALPRGTAKPAPAFEDVSSDGVLATTIRYDEHTDTVLKQLGDATRTAGDLVSDGKLAWSRAGGGDRVGGALQAWQVTDGTTVTYAGEPYFTSTARLSATADLTAENPVVDVAAVPATSYTVSVAGHYPTATFGDQTVSGVSDGDMTSFVLTGAGRLILRTDY